MQPVPIFGSGIQSYSSVATSQRRLNCYYDPRPDGDKTAAVIRSTPGSALWITLPSAPIRGWHVVGNNLFVVASRNVYRVTTAGAISLMGTLNTAVGRVEMDDNSFQICIADGTNIYLLQTTTPYTFGQVTDSNAPNGANTVAFIDGRFINEQPSSRQFTVSQSYTSSLTAAYTPYLFGTKENESSQLLAVEVVNGTIILWGANSIEFWSDVGASPLPFQRINGTTQTWGLAAIASRAKFMNTSVFLAQNPQGHTQVMMLNGYVPQRISTSDIEAIINTFSTFSDAVALTYIVDGHPMYQLTFPTGNRSFLYDGLTGLWQEVQTGVALVARHFANYGIVFNTNNYVSDATTGNIYVLSEGVFTDNGTPIKRQVRTRHIRKDGNTFGISELYLDIEVGAGLQSGQGSDPMMMIQRSKDGGKTFGTERRVSMGKVGQYHTPRLITRRWGMARDFVFQFTVTDPINFMITGGSVTMSQQEGAAG